MKILFYLTYGLALLLLISCNFNLPSPNTDDPLVLTLELEEKQFHSFDDIELTIHLLNQGNWSVLVYQRLFYLPYSKPEFPIELVILISDSSGNLVEGEGSFHNLRPALPNMLAALRPGKQITRASDLSGGYWSGLFKAGEEYTTVAIYQNELDITKTIDGVDVRSWVGAIRSNEVTFIILP